MRRVTRNSETIYGKPWQEFTDRRILNKEDRYNVRDREGKRPMDANIQEVQYADMLLCRTCCIWMDKVHFENKTIDARLRSTHGFNIHCRDCKLNMEVIACENVEQGWTIRHASVGTRVSSLFDVDGVEKRFSGKVTRYLPPSRQGKRDQLYHVVWEDGDVCDYNEQEYYGRRVRV